MLNMECLKSMQIRLLDSEEYVIPFSKSISHPHRYRILIYLLDGPHTFQYLQNTLGIARTATANHLHQLLENDLLRKRTRGEYEITLKGQTFLQLLLDFYNTTKIREINDTQNLQNHYQKAFSASNSTSPNDWAVSTPAKFDFAWISFVAAFSGVLHSLGAPWDQVDIGGFSGYYFLISTASQRLCASAPTVFRPYVWKSMIRSLESLGYTIEGYYDGISYPSGEPLTTDDRLRALHLKNWVVEGLKHTRCPVIIWGLPIPEFGIINGVKSDYYECSTYRPKIGAPDDPVHYEHLQAPGGLWGYRIQPNPQKIPVQYSQEQDVRAIQQGVKFLSKVKGVEGYTLGIDVYPVWARNLESTPQSENAYHGNSYMAACAYEQKRHLALFLDRMGKRYPNTPFGDHLLQAAKEYAQIAEFLKMFTQLFPFSLKGHFTNVMQQKGAAILRSIPPFEYAALSALQQSLKLVES